MVESTIAYLSKASPREKKVCNIVFNAIVKDTPPSLSLIYASVSKIRVNVFETKIVVEIFEKNLMSVLQIFLHFHRQLNSKLLFNFHF